MLIIEDINKLARLARIELGEEEKIRLQKDMESILGYVGQLSKVDTKDSCLPAGTAPLPSPEGSFLRRDLGVLINVMREDVATNETGEFTEDILANAPQREGDYFAVKAIFEDR